MHQLEPDGANTVTLKQPRLAGLGIPVFTFAHGGSLKKGGRRDAAVVERAQVAWFKQTTS